MKPILTTIVLILAFALQNAAAQVQESPDNDKHVASALQSNKPASVPQANWDEFTASISFTCEQWGAEIGFLTPFLVEKEILALVKQIAGPATLEVFTGYKSLPDRGGCKINERFVCVIKECETEDAR